MKKLFIGALFVLLALSSFAQVSINTSLSTGTMTGSTPNVYQSAYLHFQLVNCGNNFPVVPGQPTVMVQDSFDIRPITPGSAIVGTIIGNDQITCGNVVSTYYVVTPMKDASHPLRDGLNYVICSAHATITTCGNAASLGAFNLVTAIPMNQIPVTPGFVDLYGNPTNTQTWNQPAGTEGIFLGDFICGVGCDFNFTGATLSGVITGATPSGGLVQTGTDLGLGPCPVNDVWVSASSSSPDWICGSGGGGGGSTTPQGNPGAPQFNSSGVFAGQQDIYVGANFVWSQTLTSNLTAGTPATVTLTPCPTGINGLDNIGGVYLSGDSNPEFVNMTGGGTCVQGNSSGTITFTPLYSHSSGITIGTGSQGIYEAMASVHNYSTSPGSYSDSYRFHLAPAGNSSVDSNNPPYAYVIHGHINIPGYHVYIDGDGAVLDCFTRDYCMGQYGFGGNGNGYAILNGMRFEGESEVDGWEVASTQCVGNTVTINTTTPHGILVGDMVDVQKVDDGFYWGGSVTWHSFGGVSGRVSAVTSTSVSYQVPSGSCGSGIALATTPGHINVLNAAYFDQSSFNEFHRTQLDIGFPTGHFNNGIVDMNDQSMRVYDMISPILHSNVSTTTCTASSPYCGWYIYAPGPGSRNSAIADVYNPQFTSQCGGNGIGWFSGNGLKVYSGIMEAQVETGILTGAPTGGFGQTTITGLYSEPGGCPNPETPGGIAASVGLLQFGLNTFLTQGEGPGGFIPTFANVSGTPFYYYIQACDSVSGCSVPMYAGHGANGTGTMTVFWHRVIAVNTLTYNVLRTTSNSVAPYYNGCTGGSVNACGLVASGLAQCSGLWCSYTDNLSTATTASSVGGTRGFDTYCPYTLFWPGNVVLEEGGVYHGEAPATSLCFNNNQPTSYGVNLGTAPGQFGWGLSLGGTTLLNDNVETAGLKGRMTIAPVTNPSGVIQVAGGDIITLSDSNPFKTVNTVTERPTMDAGDIGIGNDVPGALLGATGYYVRSPTHISSYINCVPGTTGCSPQESLTKALKTIVPPVVLQNNLTIAGPTCAGCGPFTPSGTQVADACTEANGPLNSSNWTVTSGTWAYSNGSCTYTAVDGSGRALAVYTNGTFSNDQKAIATLTSIAGSGSMGLAVRGSTSADTAYTLLQQGASMSLFKVVAGTGTNLVPTCTATPPLFTVFELDVQGQSPATITVKENGVQVCSTTDSSITSGNPGFFAVTTPSSTVSMNNFFAGNLSYSTPDNLSMPPPTITSVPNSQVLCLSSTNQMGHCTSVNASTGACTCVSP